MASLAISEPHAVMRDRSKSRFTRSSTAKRVELPPHEYLRQLDHRSPGLSPWSFC